MTTGRKTHWFRNTLITLIVCGIIGMILLFILDRYKGVIFRGGQA